MEDCRGKAMYKNLKTDETKSRCIEKEMRGQFYSDIEDKTGIKKLFMDV